MLLAPDFIVVVRQESQAVFFIIMAIWPAKMVSSVMGKVVVVFKNTQKGKDEQC
jgi:hypothetical protein